MALPRYTAFQFRRPMERGLNLPFLILAEKDGEPRARVPLVVKSTAGYRNRPECIIRELFCLVFARHLGILVPEPVLVRFPDGFDYAAKEFPEYKDLIQNSPGWNLATIHLGESWKPWPDAAPPRSIPREAFESAFCFDAMVQNTDRESHNPNLLWKGDQLTLLDFDKAFGYLRTKTDSKEKPWRQILPMQNLSSHCLFSLLPEIKHDELRGKMIWEHFLDWRIESGQDSLTRDIGTDISDPKVDLPLLQEYLTHLANHTEDFFRYLTELSNR